MDNHLYAFLEAIELNCIDSCMSEVLDTII